MLAAGPALAGAAPKARICHVPPGNPANVQLLTVGAAALVAHLVEHHDAVCAPGASDCCPVDLRKHARRGGHGWSPSSICTDLDRDPENCGACGNECPAGTTCRDGECSCPAGTLLCNGACVDPGTDPANCGACGNACPSGTICSDGECSCPAGTLLCNGACVDPGTDPANCGACGNACPTGTICSDGECSCPVGTLLCNGACVDPGTDPANCGACGNACPTGTICSDGECSCPAGTLLCNGACVDPGTDPANCGACGNACPSGGSCSAGECTCPDGTTPCGGACVDDGSDPLNCGECGNQCPAGTTCSEGSCVGTCAPGQTECGGACVDQSNDPNNCGACGNVCDAGTICIHGSCAAACPPGTMLCGGVCVNQSTDPANCGACGNACAPGSTCAGGACQSGCPGGTALCGDMCVNQNTDPHNCGACGTVCGAGTTCTGGQCVSTGVAGSCLPSSSLGMLIQGAAPAATVTAYVPLGSWSELVPGVIAVPVEPAAGMPTMIATDGPVNSCSSNGATGITVCTGNSNDVYVINGTSVVSTLTAGGTGTQSFSGGDCVTCGVAMDASTGLAWIAEGTGGLPALAPGQLQSLNPTASTFGVPIDLFGVMTSENISVDPVRRLILSAVEDGNFQIIDSTTGAVFNSATSFAPLELNATAEDCGTGIAVAPGEFSSSIVFVDLSQAVYTPGAPGTWSAPTFVQDFAPDFQSFTMAGLSGIAVAPGSHLAGVTDEFGGPAFGVVQLPATSGVGVPSAVDWVAATMPDPALGVPWNMGLDPHTITAYTSPNTGRAILAVSNVERTYLALVDMQALLAAPRAMAPLTHTVDPAVDLVGTGIVTFIAE